tara:strand:+ start:9211 stop:10191 length:981 start_codon:yes stop_codon:yes gene_type:complete
MNNTDKLNFVLITKAAAEMPVPETPESEFGGNEYARAAGYGAAGGATLAGLIHLLGSIWRGDSPISTNMLTALLTGGGLGGLMGAGGTYAKNHAMENMMPPSGQMPGPNVDPFGQNKFDIADNIPGSKFRRFIRDRVGLETPGSDKSASVRFLKQLQAGNPQAMLAGNKGALTAGTRGVGNPAEMRSILQEVAGGGGEQASDLAFLRKLLGTSDDAAANAATRSENAALRAGKTHQPNVEKSKEHMQAHQKGQAQKLDAEARQLKDQKRELTEGSARADAKGALRERYNDLPNTSVVDSVRHRLRSFIKALQGEGAPAVPAKQLPR